MDTDTSWERIISLTVRVALYFASTAVLGVLFGNTEKAWIVALGLGIFIVICNELSRYFQKRNKRSSFAENHAMPNLWQRVMVKQLNPHVLTYFNARYLKGQAEMIGFRSRSVGEAGIVVGLIGDNTITDKVVVLVSFNPTANLSYSETDRIPYTLDELKES